MQAFPVQLLLGTTPQTGAQPLQLGVQGADSGFEGVLQGLIAGGIVNMSQQNTVGLSGAEPLQQTDGQQEAMTLLASLLEQIQTAMESAPTAIEKQNALQTDTTLTPEETALLSALQQLLLAQQETAAGTQHETLQDLCISTDSAQQNTKIVTVEPDGTLSPLTHKQLEQLIAACDALLGKMNDTSAGSETIESVMSENNSSREMTALLATLRNVLVKACRISGDASTQSASSEMFAVQGTVQQQFSTALGEQSGETGQEIDKNKQLYKLTSLLEKVLQHVQEQKPVTETVAADIQNTTQSKNSFVEALLSSQSGTGMSGEGAQGSNTFLSNGNGQNSERGALLHQLLKFAQGQTADTGMETNDKGCKEPLMTANLHLPATATLKDGFSQTTLNDTGTETAKLLQEFVLTTDSQTVRSDLSSPTLKTINTPALNPQYLIDQINDKISATMKKGGSSVTLQLHPPSLGKVDIELSMHNNQLRAVIVAESAQVKHTLELHIDQLRTALEQQNIEIEKFSVHVGQDGSRFSSMLRERQGEKNTKNSFGSGEEDTDGQLTAEAASLIAGSEHLLLGESGRLDLFA